MDKILTSVMLCFDVIDDRYILHILLIFLRSVSLACWHCQDPESRGLPPLHHLLWRDFDQPGLDHDGGTLHQGLRHQGQHQGGVGKQQEGKVLLLPLAVQVTAANSGPSQGKLLSDWVNISKY